MTLFQKIKESGASYTTSKSERINVVLSNYISVVVAFGSLAMVVGTYFAGILALGLTLLLAPCYVVLSLLPILFNATGHNKAGRLFLCWVSPVCVFIIIIFSWAYSGHAELADYVGMRFYLFVLAFLPFLIFNVKRPKALALGLVGSMGPLLAYDVVFNYFHRGYQYLGLSERSYRFNIIEMFFSLLILGLCFYFLKRLIEERDDINEALIMEMEEQNAIVQQRAVEEAHQLNTKLAQNLQRLTEREFILNESQRIAKIGSWEYRLGDTHFFWSDEMYNIFGLNKNFEMKVKKLSDVLGNESAAIITEATWNLLRNGQSFDQTIRTKTPIGYVKWVRVFAYPIREAGRIVGVRGICHDITVFRGAMEKLQTSEAKFSKAFEKNPDLITIVREHDLLVVDVNQRVTSMLGYQKEEVIGISIKSKANWFVHEDDARRFVESYYSANGYSEYECPFKRKDGRIIQVKMTSIRVEIEGQRYRMSVTQDITARKTAEEKFTKAFDLSPDPMMIFRESDFVLVEANRKTLEISGFRGEEIVGNSAEQIGFQLWAEEDERGHFFKKYKETGNVSLEARLRRKDGSVFIAAISAQRIVLSSEPHIMVIARDITGKKQAEQEKEHAQYLLSQRIKELSVLYRANQMFHDPNKPLQEMMQEVVDILPSGWQYPEIACASIHMEGETFVTANRKESSVHVQHAGFPVRAGVLGQVEISYSEERPREAEGPFLEEERNVINVVAGMIGKYLERKQEREILARIQANLRATINNTNVMIWSVDLEFRLIAFNIPFAQRMKKQYGVDISLGNRMFDAQESPEMKEFKSKWATRYNRAISGEAFKLEEERFGTHFQYSLSPVLENDVVVGVSVFADNITEQKTLYQELAEANKQIGELKLMALRSVMNPHFIFNVLNSIQFFIAKNDRVNAINYLSTFSKLIRSVLTHSMENKIKLSAEIEMLKNYVDLEMLRFEEQFEFVLTVAPGTDTEAIEIPALLIQPYVENAILHGLYNKHDKGRLTIRIAEQEDDTLLVEVEDDGVGRTAAEALKAGNPGGHKSMGTELTEQRLKLINLVPQSSVNTVDLKNGQDACGTRVTIKIGL